MLPSCTLKFIPDAVLLSSRYRTPSSGERRNIMDTGLSILAPQHKESRVVLSGLADISRAPEIPSNHTMGWEIEGNLVGHF